MGAWCSGQGRVMGTQGSFGVSIAGIHYRGRKITDMLCTGWEEVAGKLCGVVVEESI